MLHSLFYLTTALRFGRYYHPSTGAQTTMTTASGNRYTVLLSAAIVEEFELFHDSSKQLKMSDSNARNMYSSCQIN
jgi:hypothetical protein